MKIAYSPRAIGDLRTIAAYLKPRSPQGAARVSAAIRSAIEPLKRFPRAGTPQTTEGARKLVTRKYPYLIYYVIDEPAKQIIVVTIQHSSRQREFQDI